MVSVLDANNKEIIAKIKCMVTTGIFVFYGFTTGVFSCELRIIINYEIIMQFLVSEDIL